MPVGRIILKSISESRKLAALKTDGARLLYSWLLPHVDINGSFSADASVVRGKIFTRLKKTDLEVAEYLSDLRRVGLIMIFEAEGDVYLNVANFKEKQPFLNPNREARPVIPLPPKELQIPLLLEQDSGVAPDKLRSSSGVAPDKLPLNLNLKVKVKVNKRCPPPALSEEEIDFQFKSFWAAYPREGREAKKEARRKFGARLKEGNLAQIIKAVNNYNDFLRYERNERHFERRAMGAKTFLGDRWKEFVDLIVKGEGSVGKSDHKLSEKEQQFYRARAKKEEELRSVGIKEEELRDQMAAWTRNYRKTT